jgi:hypothetical protein
VEAARSNSFAVVRGGNSWQLFVAIRARLFVEVVRSNSYEAVCGGSVWRLFVEAVRRGSS